MRSLMQHPLEALPAVLEEARAHCLPGREMATVNAVMWELHELLLRDSPRPPPSRILPFRRRADRLPFIRR